MKKNITRLYALTQFVYWMGFAATSAFASMYLLGFQVSNSVIGTVIAVANILTAVLQPAIGTLSDKHKEISPRKILAFFMILVMVMAAVLLLIKDSTIFMICIIYGICYIGMSVSQPFVNSLGMQYMNAGYMLDFGISRSLGSVGYAFSAYVLGRMADQFGIRVIPMAFIISFGIVLISVFLFPGVKNKGKVQETGKIQASKGFFRRYPSYAVMLAGLVFIYYGHMIINSFTLQIVENIGGGNTEMGTATSIAAMIEVLTMLVFTRVMKKVPLKILLRISVVFFTVKIFCTYLAADITLFYLIQFIQMLGWGIMAVGLVYYVNDIMAPEDCTKGQAYATMSYTVGCVAAAATGGVILDRLGVSTLLLCATILSAIGACIFIIGTTMNRKYGPNT